MAVRGRALHKTLILPCIFIELSVPYIVFLMVACPGYILESTTWIEIKLG